LGKKGPKVGKRAKKPILGYFAVFRGFWPPRGLPGPVCGGCFYINPSRRGPVAPPEAFREARGPEGAG